MNALFEPFKPYIALLLLCVIGITGYLSYKELIFNKKLGQIVSLPNQIISTKQVYQEAKKQVSDKIKKIQNRPKVADIVKVGSVVSPEILIELTAREREDLNVITEIQQVNNKADVVIALQDKLIIQENHKIYLWKIISGILVLIVILVII